MTPPEFQSSEWPFPLQVSFDINKMKIGQNALQIALTQVD